MVGSFISAVDPVATLAAFASVGVDPRVYALIYGESILNDAVAIVAFNVRDLRPSRLSLPCFCYDVSRASPAVSCMAVSDTPHDNIMRAGVQVCRRVRDER